MIIRPPVGITSPLALKITKPDSTAEEDDTEAEEEDTEAEAVPDVVQDILGPGVGTPVEDPSATSTPADAAMPSESDFDNDTMVIEPGKRGRTTWHLPKRPGRPKKDKPPEAETAAEPPEAETAAEPPATEEDTAAVSEEAVGLDEPITLTEEQAKEIDFKNFEYWNDIISQARPLTEMEKLAYLAEKGKIQGNPPPPRMHTTSGGWREELSDVTFVTFMNRLNNGELKIGDKVIHTLSAYIRAGGGLMYFGKEWVDWYKEVYMSEPFHEGWLNTKQETYLLGRMEDSEGNPYPFPETKLDRTFMTQEELYDENTARAYGMLASRGLIDLEADGHINLNTSESYYEQTGREYGEGPPEDGTRLPSTAAAMKYALLLKRRNRSDEEISTFLRDAGVTPAEEEAFNQLLKREIELVLEAEEVEESEDGTITIRPVGKAGKIAAAQKNLDEAKAHYDKTLAKSEEAASPAQADAVAALPRALEGYENAQAIFDTVTTVAKGSQSRGQRTGGKKDPVQGIVGGEGEAAGRDLARLAIDRVHQKTRIAQKLSQITANKNALRAANAALPADKRDEITDSAKEKAGYLRRSFYSVPFTEDWFAYQDSYQKRVQGQPGRRDTSLGALKNEAARAFARDKFGLVFSPGLTLMGVLPLDKMYKRVPRHVMTSDDIFVWESWLKERAEIKGEEFKPEQLVFILEGHEELVKPWFAEYRRVSRENTIAQEDIHRFDKGLQAMGGKPVSRKEDL